MWMPPIAPGHFFTWPKDAITQKSILSRLIDSAVTELVSWDKNG
jgi:hypothetical protein